MCQLAIGVGTWSAPRTVDGAAGDEVCKCGAVMDALGPTDCHLATVCIGNNFWNSCASVRERLTGRTV